MKEVKIFSWCDLHYRESEVSKEPAEGTVTFGLVMGDVRPELHTMDLCASHLAGITDLMKPWIEYSRPADVNNLVAGPKKPRDVASDDREHCTLCDKSYTQRQGLVAHVWKAHRGQDMPRQPAVCPTCHERFEAQGMTMHRMNRHNYDALHEALKGAR